MLTNYNSTATTLMDFLLAAAVLLGIYFFVGMIGEIETVGCLILPLLAGMGAATDSGGAAFAVIFGLPLAGYVGGWIFSKSQEGERKQATARARSGIPTNARSLGSLPLRGGIPGFRPLLVEFMSTEDVLWLAPTVTEDKPIKIPYQKIHRLEVRDGQKVFTKTDLVGGLFWGGGGAKSVQSVADPNMILGFSIADGRRFEAEFGTSLPSSDVSPQERLGLHVEALRNIYSEILSRLPQPKERETADTVVCPWCAEEIKANARICRHCDRDVSTGQKL